ncbi:hypothetical protein BpHYR1_030054 [Brachionus plicatilis]|uniref:Uncharacterized protein n=1 Tax=Brachionus plicatilis TaxID=10195 RepID=A0A3M7SLY2_BRAPC|nr:hypothetical protein BpHYR1_030054 [Brachionus plicatilis]
MDIIKISSPGGFSLEYIDLLHKSNIFECPSKTHELTIEQCLRLAKNRLVLIEESFELKKKQNDPKHSIDWRYDEFKNQIDLRIEKSNDDLLRKSNQ